MTRPTTAPSHDPRETLRQKHAAQQGNPQEAMRVFLSLLAEPKVNEMMIRLRDK